MSVGRHKDIIVVSGRAVNVPDGYGGVIEGWVAKWTGFAGITRRSGGKSIEASAVSLGSTYEFVVRTNPGVEFRKTDKIDWDGKTFGIVSIDDSNDDRFTTITATATT